MSKKIKKKKEKSNILFIIIFFIGLGVLSYPMISRYYYRIEANNQVQDFKNEVSKLDKEEIARRMKLARIYNDTFVNHLEKDPYTDKENQMLGRNTQECLNCTKKLVIFKFPR